MSGRIISTPKAPHECKGLPYAKPYTRGTIWQCDECKEKWVKVEGAQYNESYSAWRKLTTANRSGFDK